ncbi:zf-HC2 domain-containing protein [Gemmiger formicilis]|uniref:anti-sigma factor family protein n=1 Tax=Gemmiger formicilis TaxID=745368 RepID=UPI00195E391F|nr:zf-HC2 domain-containing protein [Gemmiger formicilis]MBM6914999.1 zf-HC2 domain-containing protein [Gemmiger formicilis]
MKCEIIHDLLPLYCDGLCNEASRQEIEAHVAQCKECRTLLSEMKGDAPISVIAPEPETEARVLRGVKKKFSRGRRRAVLLTVVIMLIFSVVLTGAADVPRPVPYSDGLVTAELAVDEVIDLYYHGGSYSSFYSFSREIGGRNAVFLCFDRTLRSDVMPDREGHLCIGNGLLTDFETATYQVDRRVDAVYYLVGDYLQLPGLAQDEFEQAAAEAILLWER